MARIDAFEQHSDAYDEWFDKNAEAYAAELEAIRQLLPAAGARGLEIGVGSGKFAVPLGISVGVEPSPEMAAKARALGIDVHSGVAEQLPFAAAEFDFTLMVTTICFVDDAVQSFREALRVLKPGGCILVAFVDKESELGRTYQANRSSSRFYQQATFFSTRELLSHLASAGFGNTTIKQTLIPGAAHNKVADGFGEGAFVVIKAIKEA